MKYAIFILAFAVTLNCFSQNIQVNGKIIADGDVENLHIINVTTNQNTISDLKGEFKLNCNLNDTIKILSVRYSLFKLIISKKNLEEKLITCVLSEKINELNEVILGKILTGDLNSDITNFKGNPPINFFDLGIEGYKGKPKTLNERRLFAAKTSGGFLSVDRIINRISGYTKKLEGYVALDKKKSFLENLKRKFLKELFENQKYEENIKNEFFFYYLDDTEFILECQDKNDLAIFIKLKSKFDKFLSTQKQRNDSRVDDSLGN